MLLLLQTNRNFGPSSYGKLPSNYWIFYFLYRWTGLCNETVWTYTPRTLLFDIHQMNWNALTMF